MDFRVLFIDGLLDTGKFAAVSAVENQIEVVASQFKSIAFAYTVAGACDERPGSGTGG